MDSIDLMDSTSYGKAAKNKLAPVHENFRIYSAEWLGDRPEEWEVMKVTGMEYRAAKSGPNKGKLVIPVKGTQRTAYVTMEEMDQFKKGDAK